MNDIFKGHELTRLIHGGWHSHVPSPPRPLPPSPPPPWWRGDRQVEPVGPGSLSPPSRGWQQRPVVARYLPDISHRSANGATTCCWAKDTAMRPSCLVGRSIETPTNKTTQEKKKPRKKTTQTKKKPTHTQQQDGLVIYNFCKVN